jgi:DNA-binding PadR family transcriptional regulator
MKNEDAGELNATAAALLGLLRAGAATGYDLARRAEDELGDFWTVTRSQVYRELGALSQHGLVQAQQPGARDRRPYQLTDAGMESFLVWLHHDSGNDVVRIPLLLRLAFADALHPQRLAQMAEAQRAKHAERLHRYQALERAALENGASERDLVTLRFGLRYERAVLQWFDEDLNRLI